MCISGSKTTLRYTVTHANGNMTVCPEVSSQQVFTALLDYVNAMTKSGLVITKLDEPQPLKQGVKVNPHMKKHYRIPQSIAVEARKMTFPA